MIDKGLRGARRIHGLRGLVAGGARLSSACCVALAVVACSAAVSRGMYERQAGSDLREYYDDVLKERWSPTSGIRYTGLDRGADTTTSVVLQAGDIAAVVATCDRDCIDLNIDVTEVRAEAEYAIAAESSEFGDNRAFAEFRARDAGRYNVTIGMAGCEESECYVAYLLLLDDTNLGAAYRDLSQVFWTEYSEQWPESTVIQTKSISAGQTFAVERALSSNTPFAVLAVCDTSCGNLNVEVLEPSGYSIAGDEGIGRVAFAQPAVSTSGSHTVQFAITDCATETCSVAFMLLGKPRTD